MGVQMTLDSPLRQMADAGVVIAGADAICTGLLAARWVARAEDVGRSSPQERKHRHDEDARQPACDERMLRSYDQDAVDRYLVERDAEMDRSGVFRFWRARPWAVAIDALACDFEEGETMAHEAGDIEICNMMSGPECCCSCCLVRYEPAPVHGIQKRVRCASTTIESGACREQRYVRSPRETHSLRGAGYTLTTDPRLIEHCNAGGPDGYCCECCVAQDGAGGAAGASVRSLACVSWTQDCAQGRDSFGRPYSYHKNPERNINCMHWMSKEDFAKEVWRRMMGTPYGSGFGEWFTGTGSGSVGSCRDGGHPGPLSRQSRSPGGGCETCETCCCLKPPEEHVFDQRKNYECCVGCEALAPSLCRS